jgi:hypothetical protein
MDLPNIKQIYDACYEAHQSGKALRSAGTTVPCFDPVTQHLLNTICPLRCQIHPSASILLVLRLAVVLRLSTWTGLALNRRWCAIARMTRQAEGVVRGHKWSSQSAHCWLNDVPSIYA